MRDVREYNTGSMPAIAFDARVEYYEIINPKLTGEVNLVGDDMAMDFPVNCRVVLTFDKEEMDRVDLDYERYGG